MASGSFWPRPARFLSTSLGIGGIDPHSPMHDLPFAFGALQLEFQPGLFFLQLGQKLNGDIPAAGEGLGIQPAGRFDPVGAFGLLPVSSACLSSKRQLQFFDLFQTLFPFCGKAHQFRNTSATASASNAGLLRIAVLHRHLHDFGGLFDKFDADLLLQPEVRIGLFFHVGQRGDCRILQHDSQNRPALEELFVRQPCGFH